MKNLFNRRIISATALIMLAAFPHLAMAQNQTIYLGTYSSPLSQGLYRCQLDEASGQLSEPELVADSKNPSFVALSPDQQTLYAVCEANGSAVAAWTITATGKFTSLGAQPSGGGEACHLSVDATGKNVLVANYAGGNIAVFPVQKDGSVGARTDFVQNNGSGPNAQRQEKAHAHSIYVDPTNRFVYSCDLGTDHIDIYRLDAANGKLTPAEQPFVKVPAGAGPRHLAFGGNGFVYVVNELDLTVTVFKRDEATGALTELQNIKTVAADANIRGVSTAEIFVHPSGRWLYASNRGRDTIAAYEIGANGKLSWIGETSCPKTPRGFGLSTDGRWLVVGGQDDNQLAAFRIDNATGKLTASGHSVTVGKPVSVLFVPTPAGVA